MRITPGDFELIKAALGSCSRGYIDIAKNHRRKLEVAKSAAADNFARACHMTRERLAGLGAVALVRIDAEALEVIIAAVQMTAMAAEVSGKAQEAIGLSPRRQMQTMAHCAQLIKYLELHRPPPAGEADIAIN